MTPEYNRAEVAFIPFVIAAIGIGLAIRRRTPAGATDGSTMGGGGHNSRASVRPAAARDTSHLGTIRAMRTEVGIHRRGSGKNRQTFTRYEIRFPSSGFQFRLTRQTALSRITNLFGAQDVEIGDTSFDDAFVVKTKAEDRLRTLLRSGLRGVLVRVAAAYPGIAFEDDRVSSRDRDSKHRAM